MDTRVLTHLNQQSRSAAHRHAELRVLLETAQLAPQKLWITESISHLAYAPFFKELTPEERLTYNHLFALTTVEQFIFFEGQITPMLHAEKLEARGEKFAPPAREALITFDREEREHVEMFQAWLKLARRRYPLARVFEKTPATQWIVEMVFKRPRFLIFWTVALMYVEERTTILSRRMLKEANMDEVSLEMHEKHLKDEMRHLVLTDELLREFWDPAPAWLKRLNLWILKSFFFQVFFKSYSARHTFKALLSYHPRLERFQSEFDRFIEDLPNNRAYLSQMFSPEASPRLFQALEARPEFAGIMSFLRLER